jgi:hypothetical protein
LSIYIIEHWVQLKGKILFIPQVCLPVQGRKLENLLDGCHLLWDEAEIAGRGHGAGESASDKGSHRE